MKTIILVGSETGTSLDYATRLSEDFERLSVETDLFIMDEFDLQNLLDDQLDTLIFVCSTTGDGEEPRNMRKFMKFLLRVDLPSDLFSGVNFGVFGLGDSSYEKFNYVAKRVYRRMNQLGGMDFIGFRGEGDEMKGIEFGWNSWFNVLKSKYVANDFDPLKSVELPSPKCTLIIEQTNGIQIPLTDRPSCTLIKNIRITPDDHFQDTRLLEFKMEFPDKYDFQPGDILGLMPSNEDSEVDELINLMGWNGDLIIYGIEGKFVRNWPMINDPITLKSFIKKYLDISRIPSKWTLKRLSSLCDLNAAEYSRIHYDKLIELSEVDEEYLDYVWRPKRSFLEILKDFQPTIKIGISRILQVFQPIKFRQFSIANHPKKDEVYQLLVALVKEKLPFGRGEREGLCSRWIKGIKLGDQIVYEKSSGSLSPQSLKRTMFLFGAGTGIAPLRSLIQYFDRKDYKIFLYFGCRSIEKDFYFKDEWKKYENLTLFVAGSRDNSSKVYLDALIKSNSGPLLNVTDPSEISCVVAGHTRLSKMVQNALNEIWIDKTWVEYLKTRGQFQIETWS